MAYTLYLYNEGFRFTRAPVEVEAYLDRMLALAGGTPVATVETGWSTAVALDGSEQAQASYVHSVMAALSQRRQRIRFLCWFFLHDSRREDCAEHALTFIPPGVEFEDAVLEDFVTFLCHLRLRRADGTPKLAWEVRLGVVSRY